MFSHFTLSFRLRLVVGGVLIACVACSAVAPMQPEEIPRSKLIRIVSPRDGELVEPGSTIRVEVQLVPGSPFREVMLVPEGFAQLPEPLSEPPFEFILTVSRDVIGPRKITAIGVIAPGDVAFSEPVTVEIETHEPASSLILGLSTLRFRHAGAVVFLHVEGVFADSTPRRLNNSRRIRFESLDEAVAIVSPTGKITATGPGTTYIRVRYGDLERDLPVTVPRTIDGDLTGDKMVSEDDLNVIRSAFGSKGSATATGPFDARDRNKDGIIDERDVELLRQLCTNKDCSSRRAER